MFHLFSRLFPYQRLKNPNRAIKILIVSDTIFYGAMALVEVVFSVFIINNIKGASVEHLGIGNALFMVGILLTEPLFSRFYDTAKTITASFYGFVIGNLLKAVFRVLFVFISSISMFYLIYFLLGIVHSIEYPSFSKLFTKYIDKNLESSEWGYKDTLVSLGRMITLFFSGYIVIAWGYNALFIISAITMVISGVLLPLAYKKDFIGN